MLARHSIRALCRRVAAGALILVMSIATAASAADKDAELGGLTPGNLMTVISLLLLLVLAATFLLRFSRRGRFGLGMNGVIKILTTQSLGTKEKIALVEVNGQQLLLGITSSQIRTLYELHEPVDLSETEGRSQFSRQLKLLQARKGE